MRTCYGEDEQHQVGVCLPSRNGPLIYRAASLYRLSVDKLAAVEEGRKGKTEADRQAGIPTVGWLPPSPSPTPHGSHRTRANLDDTSCLTINLSSHHLFL